MISLRIFNKVKINKLRRDKIEIRILAVFVLINGIYLIVSTLLREFRFHQRIIGLDYFVVDLDLIIGLSLIYLSNLLMRRKKTAWIAALLAYGLYLASNLENYLNINQLRHLPLGLFLRDILIPAIILLILIINYQKFRVKSDLRSIRTSMQFLVLILILIAIYGLIGFKILGKDGFGCNLSLLTSLHYTFDQVNLTTNQPLTALNRQASLFIDSLRIISVFAFLFIFLSFFKPIREKYQSKANLEYFKELLFRQHDAISEDYFKIYPKDKHYFFDSTKTSALAFRVHHRIALVLGGPTGKNAKFKQLLNEFNYLCTGNDWQMAVIHSEEKYLSYYKEMGFTAQLIGQEAVVNLNKFIHKSIHDKYFRNILNRFQKQFYEYQILKPPHDDKVLDRLEVISNQWLKRGGHLERGFAMGWFSKEYMNNCQLIVALDQDGTIQAFLNLVPAYFDKEEATYDLLRSSNQALANVNDFLLVNLINELKHQGYKRLNLGLCPLVGVDKIENDNKTFIDSLLRFAYANGDKFYSFNGLFRFKNKYYPTWRNRYIIYKGGLKQFTAVNRALMVVMRKSVKS